MTYVYGVRYEGRKIDDVTDTECEVTLGLRVVKTDFGNWIQKIRPAQ